WSQQSLLWGRQLGHPHSLGYALTWAAILNLLRRGDQDALRLLEELTTLCRQHGFSHFLARANIMRGYVLAAGGQNEKGGALARQGFADMLSNVGGLDMKVFFCLIGPKLRTRGTTRRSKFTAIEGSGDSKQNRRTVVRVRAASAAGRMARRSRPELPR